MDYVSEIERYYGITDLERTSFLKPEEKEEFQNKELFKFSIIYDFEYDYSKDEDYYVEIKDTLIHNADVNSCERIIIDIVGQCSPKQVKIAYLGSNPIKGFNLLHYCFKGNNNAEDAELILDLAITEIGNRKKLFTESHVRRIS